MDRSGQLIASDDDNLVLKRLSFADRPLIQRSCSTIRHHDLEFVQGDYINEHGVRVLATGLHLPGMTVGRGGRTAASHPVCPYYAEALVCTSASLP